MRLADELREIAANLSCDMDGEIDSSRLFYEESDTLDLRAMANAVNRLEALAKEVESEHVYPHQDYRPT
ncbi:MAG: hypothetical protein Q7U75_00755 [Desulfobacterales bacterium]|nr:hypothetical protein [Desulfobacterales bacterium]